MQLGSCQGTGQVGAWSPGPPPWSISSLFYVCLQQLRPKVSFLPLTLGCVGAGSCPPSCVRLGETSRDPRTSGCRAFDSGGLWFPLSLHLGAPSRLGDMGPWCRLCMRGRGPWVVKQSSGTSWLHSWEAQCWPPLL